MEELEEEIEKPTGIWTVRPPELRLEGVLVSQDCGVLFRITNTTGLKCVFLTLSFTQCPTGLGQITTAL